MIEIGTPFSITAQKEGKAKSLFDVGEAMGPTQLTLWAARAPFIAAHRAVLVDFFEDMQTMLHWYLDPGPPRRGHQDRRPVHQAAGIRF